MRIATNGTTINCAIDGEEGKPWLTFSNSLCTDLEMWAPQVKAFAADYRILRYDTRGHGASDVPPGPYDPAMMAKDVIGLWDALGIAKSHFVGLSMGGVIGLALALDHPARVSSVAVCDSRANSHPVHMERWAARSKGAIEHGMAWLADDFTGHWFTPAAHAAKHPWIAPVHKMVAATKLEGYLAGVNVVTSVDFRPRLAELAVPMLFLAGAQDIGDFPDQAKAMHAAVPGSSLTLIEGAAHLCNLEKPDAFNAAVAGHLNWAAWQSAGRSL
jgi:3-oxoadipate enol-lactonase